MSAGGVRLPAGPLVAELAARLGGACDGACGGRAVERIVPPEGEHDRGCLVPVWSARHLARVRGGEAVVLTSPELGARLPEGARWVHEHPLWALSELLAPLDEPPPDRRALAYVEEGAEVHPSARLGPFAVVRAGARVGEGCVVDAHAVLYGRVTLGRRVSIGAGAVLGRPGFGWATGPGGAVRRVPHLGGVEVADEVDVGPGATVDAGTLGPTRVGRGAKLDAHVHVAHNVQIGPGAFVAAQAGFAGSVELGARALVGGQVGVADHVRVGEGARLAAKAGVVGNIPPFTAVAGYPAVPRWQWLRGMARLFGRRPPTLSSRRPSTPFDATRRTTVPHPSSSSMKAHPVRLPSQLDIRQILQVLPHRYPFVLVDRVTEIVPGKSIRGHKCVAYNEPWFAGHFPKQPIMPGVMILEAMAQLGGILAYASEPFDASRLMYFLGIDKAKFRKPVVPGDRLDLACEVMQQRTNVWKLRGEASVEGALCAQGELLASVVDRMA